MYHIHFSVIRTTMYYIDMIPTRGDPIDHVKILLIYPCFSNSGARLRFINSVLGYHGMVAIEYCL